MNSPLYCSGLTPDGIPLLAGLFRLRDECGFPVDMAYEIAKEKGQCPDWAEFLADAGAQPGWKFDAAFHEIEMLLGPTLAAEILQRFKRWGASVMAPGDDFISICQRLLDHKRSRALHLAA